MQYLPALSLTSSLFVFTTSAGHIELYNNMYVHRSISADAPDIECYTNPYMDSSHVVRGDNFSAAAAGLVAARYWQASPVNMRLSATQPPFSNELTPCQYTDQLHNANTSHRNYLTRKHLGKHISLCV